MSWSRFHRSRSSAGRVFLGISLALSIADGFASSEYSEVFDILEARCVECHGPEYAEKDLRLDEERYARKIGHLGTAILGPTRAESELFERITSDDPDFRMPPEGAPLNEEEIEIIGAWIDAGSPWESDIKESLNSKMLEQVRRKYWAAKATGIWKYWMAGTVLLAFGHGYARRKGRFGARFPILNRVTHAHFVIVFLIFAVFATRRIYVQKVIDHHQLWSEKAREYIEEHTNSAQFLVGDRPTAARPSHPRRMGGTYYRGNDERDPRLYNNGFYRTATMELSLHDSGGRRLDWGDALSEDGYIELEIKRAPAASPSLFTRRVMDRVFLTREWLPRGGAAVLEESPVLVEEQEENRHWIARYPLKRVEKDIAEGAIYVYLGNVGAAPAQGAEIKGEVSYGIHYRFELDSAGQILPTSELWMGSLTSFAYIAYPPEGSIPLPEWFDWRPIPLVVGENPDMPDLINGATP